MTDATVSNDARGGTAERMARQAGRAPVPERATSRESVPLTRAPSYASTTWGPYYEALHPPGLVHFIINWKVVPKWTDHAAELWRRRQELRRAYAAAPT